MKFKKMVSRIEDLAADKENLSKKDREALKEAIDILGEYKQLKKTVKDLKENKEDLSSFDESLPFGDSNEEEYEDNDLDM